MPPAVRGFGSPSQLLDDGRRWVFRAQLITGLLDSGPVMKFGGRNSMFRKHFRFKRLALGLAFAALAVPATSASAASTFVDGGPVPVSLPATLNNTQSSYLRYHQLGGVPSP